MTGNVPSDEQDESYDVWFRRRVEESLADPGSNIAHDDVMAEVTALLARRSLR